MPITLLTRTLNSRITPSISLSLISVLVRLPRLKVMVWLPSALVMICRRLLLMSKIPVGTVPPRSVWIGKATSLFWLPSMYKVFGSLMTRLPASVTRPPRLLDTIAIRMLLRSAGMNSRPAASSMRIW
ncbi:hypothetical protein D3C76_1453700 [compost metagenome]